MSEPEGVPGALPSPGRVLLGRLGREPAHGGAAPATEGAAESDPPGAAGQPRAPPAGARVAEHGVAARRVDRVCGHRGAACAPPGATRGQAPLTAQAVPVEAVRLVADVRQHAPSEPGHQAPADGHCGAAQRGLPAVEAQGPRHAQSENALAPARAGAGPAETYAAEITKCVIGKDHDEGADCLPGRSREHCPRGGPDTVQSPVGATARQNRPSQCGALWAGEPRREVAGVGSWAGDAADVKHGRLRIGGLRARSKEGADHPPPPVLLCRPLRQGHEVRGAGLEHVFHAFHLQVPPTAAVLAPQPAHDDAEPARLHPHAVSDAEARWPDASKAWLRG